ncbi:MAG TPA: Trm112 family protein [Candidatus Brocadiia bacterium]|nr:Trm112 family protein [Candidatus Brocadiia bacterium]
MSGHQKDGEISKRLLEILACPLCKVRVELSEGRLVCGKCGRRYPIREGIPIMLPEEAEMPEAGEGER